MRISDAAIFEHSEKTADEQGLAGANVPRQRQESFPPLNTMVKRKQRLLMSSGEIQKLGIGNNFEGIKPQFVKFFVHDFCMILLFTFPGVSISWFTARTWLSVDVVDPEDLVLKKYIGVGVVLPVALAEF